MHNDIAVVDYKDHQAPRQFATSLKKTGFAVIKNHPIKIAELTLAYEKWQQFFAASEVQKSAFEFDPKNHDGYASTEKSETAKGNSQKDLKEFYHFYPWARVPEFVEGLKSITFSMYDQLNLLAAEILQWVEADLPSEISEQLSMPLAKMIDHSKHTLLRIIHYPPLKGNEPAGSIRAAAHEDINLLTLLPAATAKGLQAQTNDGQWIDVPVDPSYIVVNSGDMLAECTDNYYQATTHRVINPTDSTNNQSRLSMPLFLHPREEVILSKRHTAASYRAERFAELGLDE